MGKCVEQSCEQVPVDEELHEVVALGVCDCGDRDGKIVQVYLSRRNLLTLLNKLDYNRDGGGSSKCTLIKRDDRNVKYPQSHKEIFVTAVEDEDYYSGRLPGFVLLYGGRLDH